jgi:predicted permease
MNDLSLAFRLLAKSRGFTVLALLVLALGIGGNTIVFSLVSALYLKPLPFPHSGQLVDLDETAPQWNLRYVGINYRDFEAWRAHNQTFSAMATARTGTFNVATSTRAEQLTGEWVTHDMADVFGFQPVLGRMFRADEELGGGAKVVLIGDAIWREWFAASPEVLGQRLTIDTESYEIIGVLPATAALPLRAALWRPFESKPNAWGGFAVGRLKPGISVAQASADLLRVHRALLPAAPENAVTSPVVQPLRQRYLGDGRVIAFVLEGAVLVLLLIVCANIAGLMLARTLSRTAEIGIRSALGATRWKIFRQLWIESALLTATGALLGMLAAQWLLDGWLAWVVAQMPPWTTVEFDVRVIGYVATAAFLCATLGALLPAHHVLRRLDLKQIVGTGQQSTPSRPRVRALRLLVVAEIGLALVLLIAAGLFGRALLRVQRVDPGFEPQHVLTYELFLPELKYRDGASRIDFLETHLARLRALPGIEAAGATTILPLTGQHLGNFFEPEGGLPTALAGKSPAINTHVTLPGYFKAMGIPVLRGTPFTAETWPYTLVINEAMERLFWPGQSAVGKHVRTTGEGSPWLQVVAVVHDVRHDGLEAAAQPEVYVPYYAMPQPSVTLVVRTPGEATAFAPTIRALLKEQDPLLPVAGLSSMEDRLQQSMFLRRMYSGMTAAFAIVAVVMAVAGLYGLIGYVVGQRMREFGIRLALGAQVRDLIYLVLREGLRLAIAGVSLGAAGGVLAGFALSRLLVGVSPLDPLVLSGTIAALGATIVMACLVPAQRAARVSVQDILRTE